MTGDFAAFLDAVREAARKNGINAYVVCGVASTGEGGRVQVVSRGLNDFEDKNEQFIERCVAAMDESIQQTLAQMEGSDEPESPGGLPN